MLVLEHCEGGAIAVYLSGEGGSLEPVGAFTVEELAEALYDACSPGDPGADLLFDALVGIVRDSQSIRTSLR